MKIVKYLVSIIISFSTYYIVCAENDIFVDKYNARAVGMGNNFVSISEDSSAIFYNPAGLGQIESPSFSCMYADIHSSGIVKNFILSGASKYKDLFSMGGGWCLSIINLDPENWCQHRFFYGISYLLFDKIYIGATSKLFLIKTEIDQRNIWGYGFDIGFLASSKSWEMRFLSENNIEINLGVSMYNLYSQIEWSDSYNEKIPFDLSIGINFYYNEIINAVAQVNSINKEIVGFSFGNELYLLKLIDYQFKEEYKITEIVLRAGLAFEKIYRSETKYSAGIGIICNNYSFDYAIVYQYDYFAPTHYFSLNVNNWSI